MGTQSALALASAEVMKQQRVTNRLLAEAASVAAKEKAQKEAGFRANRRNRVICAQTIRQRTEQALCGLKALVALGSSPQCQKLIETRDAPLRLYGGVDTGSPGGDMSDCFYRNTSYIDLDRHAVRIRQFHSTSGDYGMNYTVERGPSDPDSYFSDFEYAAADTGLWLPALRIIATFYELDWDQLEHQASRWNSDAVYHKSEVLFEVLAECAEPEILARHFRSCLRR